MNEQDLNTLWHQHGKRIILQFKQGGLSREEAEDLSQEVFYQLLKERNKHVPILNPGAWLTIAAKNKLVDFYRRRNSMQQLEGLKDENMSQETHGDEAFRNCLEQQVKYCFNCFLKEIDEESQFILTAVELENKSQKQLAREMHISYPTLRSKVQRARKKIRDKFFAACSIQFDPAGSIVSCSPKCA
jgi:RNA polymerase sigma-70 factor (ECF subfamily)